MVMTSLSTGATREISGLANLPRDALVERWEGLFSKEPAKRLTKDFLVRGIAYEIQAGALGGFTDGEKREILALASGQRPANLPKSKTGMRLYRTWRGVTHEVLVLECGYSWKDKRYESLSEVARAITGTRWSGPRFFGVAT
jgi:hypothetical protein